MRPALLAALALLLSPGAAQAAVYASPSGNDTNPGTQDAPVRTITRALALAKAGGNVSLTPGEYPQASDSTRHADTTVVSGPGAVVAGALIHGAANLTLRGLSFTAGVRIDAASANITIEGSDLTGGCVNVRDRSIDVAITGNRIHDCHTGISAPGRVTPDAASARLTITGNVISGMTSDGMQLSDVNDVVIRGNVITGIRDPGPCVSPGAPRPPESATLRECVHSDDIQLTGGNTGVVIEGNTLGGLTGPQSSSAILMQPAQRGTSLRPIDDVTVRGNAINRAAAVAIQSQGVTRARFEANTGCFGVLGGLWLRKWGSVAPTDTIVRGNVWSSLREMEGAKAALTAGNVVGC